MTWAGLSFALFDLPTFAIAGLLPFIAVGFAAQLIGGALGMAFGTISSTLLLSLGIPPAAGVCRCAHR
jgi:uncharacterized membrane protein YfcA